MAFRKQQHSGGADCTIIQTNRSLKLYKLYERGVLGAACFSRLSIPESGGSIIDPITILRCMRQGTLTIQDQQLNGNCIIRLIRNLREVLDGKPKFKRGFISET